MKALCGQNFCTTEIFFGMAYFFCLNKPLFVWAPKFYHLFFKKRDRLLYIVKFFFSFYIYANLKNMQYANMKLSQPPPHNFKKSICVLIVNLIMFANKDQDGFKKCKFKENFKWLESLQKFLSLIIYICKSI